MANAGKEATFVTRRLADQIAIYGETDLDQGALALVGTLYANMHQQEMLNLLIRYAKVGAKAALRNRIKQMFRLRVYGRRGTECEMPAVYSVPVKTTGGAIEHRVKRLHEMTLGDARRVLDSNAHRSAAVSRNQRILKQLVRLGKSAKPDVPLADVLAAKGKSLDHLELDIDLAS